MLENCPTLETFLMVKKTIKKYSQEYDRRKLWKKLPEKVNYQTFLTIIDYLEKNCMVRTDNEGIVFWTYDPEGIKRILSTGVKLR